ncbi:MAG: polysaccharide biosynthesis protein [Clostridia bacterium]|nr:polysaccharide biosynthesis protein [Clostridia bacterium]
MSNKKTQNFVEGALILMIANILVKVIGAVFKIPLNYLLGDEGMGYFGTAYTVYNWLFIVATAGMPVAISKMVAESRATGNNRRAHRIFTISLRLLAAIGIAGFAFLYFGADFCANLMASPSAGPGIRALSPAILFVALMSVYRGFFQGQQNMLPTAISEVCEALGKLVIGYGAAMLLVSSGIEKAAAGAVFGVSAGGFLALMSLTIIYIKNRKNILPYSKSDSIPAKSSGAILRELVRIAVPITIGASVFSLTSIIDAAMIMRRLQESAGFGYDAANALWGAYTGKSITMFNLVPTLITAISISIVPTIASAFATKNFDKAQEATGGSLKITILLTAPCAVGMAILAGPILQLIFRSTSAESTLSILSYGIVFVSLVSLTNAILQATDNAVIPVIHMVVGGIAKVIVNYILVGHPSINIAGAPIGTILCYVVILCLNLVSIRRIIHIRYNVASLVIKPLVSVIVMAAAVLGVYNLTSALGNTAATVLSIAAGGIVYVAVLFATGGISASDVRMLPKSDKLLPVLKKYRLIKE